MSGRGDCWAPADRAAGERKWCRIVATVMCHSVMLTQTELKTQLVCDMWPAGPSFYRPRLLSPIPQHCRHSRPGERCPPNIWWASSIPPPSRELVRASGWMGAFQWLRILVGYPLRSGRFTWALSISPKVTVTPLSYRLHPKVQHLSELTVWALIQQKQRKM